jgi:early secretory antigenic target protein ESAT-6
VSEQKWEFAGIEAGASAIQASVGTTQGLLDEGNTSLKNLAAAWGGSGSEAYQAVQARWDATSAELNTRLRELANRISEAQVGMGLVEKGVGNLFSG